jgi:4-hydroxybenzoate polyprenyltransferase
VAYAGIPQAGSLVSNFVPHMKGPVTPPKGARDGQLIDGASLPVRLANFVKLPHTVFAMPFALVGLLMASTVAPLTGRVIGWVLLAFTAARFAAMGFNRIVDRDVDAVNPRTANRELPRGALTLAQAKGSVIVASLMFVWAAYELNALCAWLSPIALFWVLGYSYTKRFTRWSHLWLGLGLSIAPVGGYLAVTGQWSDPWWLLCALAMVVVTWSGGFDILYALQDADFDKANGLHSIPSTIGVPSAIRLSRALHVVSVLSLSAVVASQPLNAGGTVQTLLWVGVAGVAAMLVWEHRLVRPNDLSKLDAAFFTMNGMISIGFFAVVLIARFVAGGWL